MKFKLLILLVFVLLFACAEKKLPDGWQIVHNGEYYDDYIAETHSLHPSGTDSTMFTTCCFSAISNNECQCPSCGRLVVGYDAETSAETGRVRWQHATANWQKEVPGVLEKETKIKWDEYGRRIKRH